MTGYLNALVTFDTQGDRRRAVNAVRLWVTNWNATHPGQVFIGQCDDASYTYPDDYTDYPGPGVTLRALQASYMCTSYQGIEDAQRAISSDVVANAYVDVMMSTWQY